MEDEIILKAIFCLDILSDHKQMFRQTSILVGKCPMFSSTVTLLPEIGIMPLMHILGLACTSEPKYNVTVHISTDV